MRYQEMYIQTQYQLRQLSSEPYKGLMPTAFKDDNNTLPNNP